VQAKRAWVCKPKANRNQNAKPRLTEKDEADKPTNPSPAMLDRSALRCENEPPAIKRSLD